MYSSGYYQYHILHKAVCLLQTCQILMILVMMAQGQQQWQQGSGDQHGQVTLGKAARVASHVRVTSARALATHNLWQDMDRGHVQEGAGAEEHGDASGVHGVPLTLALTSATGMEKEKGQHGRQGSTQGKGHQVLSNSTSIQVFVQQKGGQAKGRGSFVQHDGQEHDHLHIRLKKSTIQVND